MKNKGKHNSTLSPNHVKLYDVKNKIKQKPQYNKLYTTLLYNRYTNRV